MTDRNVIRSVKGESFGGLVIYRMHLDRKATKLFFLREQGA
jgi:hypothetical protein